MKFIQQLIVIVRILDKRKKILCTNAVESFLFCENEKNLSACDRFLAYSLNYINRLKMEKINPPNNIAIGNVITQVMTILRATPQCTPLAF